MTMKRNPVSWFGGKYYMAKHIVSIIENIPHTTYVEPFGGAAHVLIRKMPSKLEVYNDLDDGLVNFYVVVSNPNTFDQLLRRLELMPYSRGLYNMCRKSWHLELDPVEKAWKWYIVMRQSFSGHFGHSWGYSLTDQGHSPRAWVNILPYLAQLHERFKYVQIEHDDAFAVIRRYNLPHTLFYLDPPYVHETRVGKERYRHELSIERHRQLVDLMLSSNAQFILSAYAHDVYQPLLDAGWELKTFRQPCLSLARTRETNLRGSQTLDKQKHYRIEALYIKPYQTTTSETTS